MTEPRTTGGGVNPASSDTKVISIISGKGGVGKSIVAFNLAERLASAGRRVLLIDADMNFGNLHILANHSGEYGLREFIRQELSLKEAASTCRHGFDLLAAGGGEIIWTDGSINPIAAAVSRLRQEGANYDVIILDHGSGVSRAATVMAHASDISILMLVPELTSIADCYGLLKHLKAADSHIDCRLLVNRVEKAEQAQYIHTKLCAVSERFIDRIPAYLGYLTEDKCFSESIARQSTLAECSPEANAVKELTVLARRLLRTLTPESHTISDKSLKSDPEINKTAALADIRE